MSTYLPVGVFDSGVGGLTIVRSIRQRLPEESLIYVADNAYAPYGTKTREKVTERSLRVADWLVSQGVKAIVLACNTATAAAVEQMRSVFDIPIVAMEPAIKPAAEITRTDVIGVLATAGTLDSERYARLVDRHGQHIQVLKQVCHHWVEQVESGDLSSSAAHALVDRHVQPLITAGADVLVLGCTHFPLLAPLIGESAGAGVRIVDPAPAVAEQLYRQLEQRALLNTNSGPADLSLWKTAEAGLDPGLIRSLLGVDLPVKILSF